MMDAGLLVKLEEYLDKEYRDRTESVINGNAQHYADYRYRCGYLQAIRDIGLACRDISDKLHGRAG